MVGIEASLPGPAKVLLLPVARYGHQQHVPHACLLTKPPCDLVAVHTWKANVQEDGLGRASRRQCARPLLRHKPGNLMGGLDPSGWQRAAVGGVRARSCPGNTGPGKVLAIARREG